MMNRRWIFASLLIAVVALVDCKGGGRDHPSDVGIGGTAAEAGSGDESTAVRFNVGYRVMDLPYRDGNREDSITVAVWYPTAAPTRPYNYGGPTTGNIALDAAPRGESGPYPLLVFSHGYSGGGIGSVFFTEALAAHGWVVVCPDHHDGHSAVRIRTGQVSGLDRRGMLREASEITSSGPEDRAKYLYRVNEMKCVLDHSLDMPFFREIVDSTRVAVGGHSFGGFTALGLCGAIPDRLDRRIKAVMLFSTGAGGYLYTADELAAVGIPSMLFMGEREAGQKRGERTMLELEEKVHAALPAPKYFLVVKDGNHFSFNNRFSARLGSRLLSGTEEQFEVIRRYAIAFLETYVAGRAASGRHLERGDPMITRYEKER